MGGIYDIARHPTDSSILYMTTNCGLVKVVDKGSLSTTKLGRGLPRAPHQIEINSKNPLVMYVTVGVGGVYKSTDGGGTFVPSNSGLNMVDPAFGLTISPADPNYLYVSYQDSNVGSAPFGFFYSHNGGATWEEPETMDEGGLIGGLHGVWVSMVKGHSYSTPIAAHPTNKDIAVSNHFTEKPIRTTNGGNTWKYSSSGYTGSASGVSSVSPIAWDRNNKNRFFMMFHDFGAFLTEDGGETFRTLNTSNAFAGVLDKELIVTVRGSWTSQKIIISRNYGKTFSEISGTDASYRSMFLHPQNTTTLYAQYRKFPNIRTSDSFVTLTQSIQALYPKNGDIVYSVVRDAITKNFTILKSTDGGAHWSTPYPQLTGTANLGIYTQMAVDPQNENRIYVAVRNVGVFIVTNTLAQGGYTLVRNEQNGITKDQFGTINPISIVVDPRHSHIIYIGTRAAWYGTANGVFRSADYGMTWSNITQKSFGPYLDTLALAVSPFDGTLFMSGMIGNWRYLPSID